MTKNMKVNPLNVKKILKDNQDVTICAATKYVNYEEIDKLVELGITNIAENRVDSFLEAYNNVRYKDKITWHFIGQLQTKKVKQVVNKIDYLHSLDNLHLAKEIQKRREVIPLKCFVEINLGEKNKSGVSLDMLDSFMKSLKDYDMIQVIGFMAMAHNSTETVVENDFRTAQTIKDKYGYNCLSMGMSQDYKIAKMYGSTHIRLGRILFSKE